MAVDEVTQLKNRLKDARANAQKAEDGLRRESKESKGSGSIDIDTFDNTGTIVI